MKNYTKIMFASVNHELRTPINGIQNSLMCLKPHVDPLAQQYFDICESSASFLLSLVNDTLDYAQLQSGKFKCNLEEVDVRQLV
jgi:signal transduction histidine kinase